MEVHSHRSRTPPAVPLLSPQHPQRAPSAPLPLFHRSQECTPSPGRQHSQRASSAQGQLQGHPRQRTPSYREVRLQQLARELGEKKVKQFKELARNLAEQDTVEDIINWNEHLWSSWRMKRLLV